MRSAPSLFLLFLLLLGGCVARSPGAEGGAPAREIRVPVTILVSIDGFRPDYLERGITPNLDRLAAGGVTATMRPVFPTKTFPNHYSLVTGLRPDQHGVVDNNMEDPRRPEVKFTISNGQAQDRFWWDEAEPIWVTAEKQGIRTGTMFWPGSEAAIQGVRPANWQRFDGNISNVQRVATIVDWLRRPVATRPRLITLYFEDVDEAAHDFGIDSAEALAAVKDVDGRIGDLVAELSALEQPVNFVILSDHGMAPGGPDKMIWLHRTMDVSGFRVISDGAFLTAEPLPGREAEVEKLLLKPHEHMQCWTKEKLPGRFLYGRHPRVPRYFCLAETGWIIRASEPKGALDLANHGYDNMDPSMTALFIASGPAFARGVTLPMFDNVDVYPLLARLLGIEPRPNHGNPATFDRALKR
jgi:predicted AlkP superfamily pyrophosphatase or phosphodiesterase